MRQRATTLRSVLVAALALAAGGRPLGSTFAAAQGEPFQPSAPYYATFFYPWYPQWTDRGHTPPQNWFSNYLPDPKPGVFDPPTELYSSTDGAIVYWQLHKLAESRLEVAISSWWGVGHKTDVAFRFILNDVMNRADVPYPNLRWALYYEKESLGDPSPDELVADLEYIKSRYTVQRAYLKVGGRPVIFVYASGSDAGGMAARWAEARSRTGFYVVLKVYGGYRSDPNQPDSWHQYAPARRTDTQAPHSFMVSPGFWLDGEDVRLPRDLDAFRAALRELVAAPVSWKLVETWNEWGEGTAVEPGDPVIQTKTGTAVFDPAGPPFQNRYVEALKEVLPPLEQGTGAMDRAFVLPQFGSGVGLASTLVLTNPSAAQPVRATLRFFGDDGQPRGLRLAGLPDAAEVPVSIAPLGIFTAETREAEAMGMGSLVVNADGELGASALLGLVGFGSAGVGASTPSASFLAPVLYDARSSTGIAFANANPAAVSATVTLQDDQGARIGSVDLSLPARGQLARFVHELFPALPSHGFKGTLSVRADQPLNAIAVRLAPGSLTTLPVTPVR